MGRLLLFGCSALLLVGSGLGKVWEFGEDREDSVILFTSSGDMSLFQKIRRVQLPVEPCYRIIYVRVEVQNKLATPIVTYDENAYIVTIKYSRFQISISTYRVLAKVVRDIYCESSIQAASIFRNDRLKDSAEMTQNYGFNSLDYHSLMELLKKLKLEKQKYINTEDQFLPAIRGVPYYY